MRTLGSPKLSGISGLGKNRPLTRAIGEAGVVGFTPLSLPSLVAWYDPSDLSTMFQDTAGTVPVTAAGQSVARINDKSGNGRNLLQATGANQPTLEVDGNGKRYLDFNGTTDFMSVAITVSAYPFTLWCAAKADADANGGAVSLVESDTSYKAVQKNAVANQWVAVDRNVSLLSSGETVGTNATPHSFIAEFASATFDLNVDGTTPTAPTANTNAAGALVTLAIGRVRPAGFYLDGRIYQAGVNLAALSSAQKSALNGFISRKAGI